MLKKTVLAVVCAAAAFAAQAATPSHLYLLDGTFSDSMGGPALSGLGGTLSATGYSFAANEGLSVDGAVNSGVYTIDMSFSFDTLSGYKRIIDFKNLASDTGLYELSTQLNFYNVATGAGAPFVAGQMTEVTITRTAAGVFTGYVNGVQQIVFDDSASELAVFSGPAQIAYFFRDDNSVPGEASAGYADYIRIYDSALSSGEVAGLTYPVAVPEPASTVLLLAGLLAVGGAVRRR